MRNRKKIWLLRMFAFLCALTLAVGILGEQGFVTTIYGASLKQTSGSVLVKKTKDDTQVIPDKYNAGASGKLKKVGLGDTVKGIKLVAASDGTKNCFDFYYRNKTVTGTITFENYDFSDYPVVMYHADQVNRKIKLVFKNCKFSGVALNRNSSKVTFQFYKCTFRSFSGSDATFDRCKFGGSYSDGLVPFRNITVKNSFFYDLGSMKCEKKEYHSDGTQIYGWKGIDAENIVYQNCRFETPSVAPQGSKAYVNACIMLQMEFSNADSIKFQDCIVNGGGYSIYAESKYEDYTLKNVSFQNIRVGCTKKYGTLYPKVSSGVTLSNIQDTGALYIGSVWKRDGKTHLSVTNDTCRKRKLLIITDKGTYRYTIGACKKGSQLTKSDTYGKMPFDQKIVIPANCKYIICYDNTFSGAAEQIRYVNWSGKKVYLSKKEYENLFSGKNDILASGKCGNNVRYTLTKSGTLTLKGSGATYSYHSSYKAPWDQYSDLIKTVKVGKGITKLGNQLFQGYGALQKVELPLTLVEIGSRTFYGCTGLESVTLPKGVKTIGNNAFSSRTKTKVLKK